jgi:hypothetical protein
MWKRSLKRQIQLISSYQDDCSTIPYNFLCYCFLILYQTKSYFKGGSPPSIPNPPFFLASPNLGDEISFKGGSL